MRGLSHRAGAGVRVAGVLLAGAGAVRLLQHAAEDGVALAMVGVALVVAGLVFTAPPPVFDNEWRPVQASPVEASPIQASPAEAGPAGAAPQPRPAPRPALTRAEALAILGLVDPVEPREVLAAYRRAMMAAHPDRGGTAEWAARVVAARDVLLGRPG